jgi:hypothetical protein
LLTISFWLLLCFDKVILFDADSALFLVLHTSGDLPAFTGTFYLGLYCVDRLSGVLSWELLFNFGLFAGVFLVALFI